MKIVHVEDYFDPLAGYQINEILNLNIKSKGEVYLITSDDMSPFHKVVNKNEDLLFEERTGVKIIRLKSKIKVSSRVILKNLWKEIEYISPDLVFLHGIGDFKDLILWKKNRNYKIIRDCHMSWVASKNKFAKLYYKFFKFFFANIINKTDKYKKVFALGVEEYEYLKEIGIEDKKIGYLYHGYNDEVMFYDEENRRKIRTAYGFKESDIIISYIGKFNYAKRPDLVIDIVNKLSKDIVENNNIKLLFIGSKDKEFMITFNKKLEQLNNNIQYVVDEAKSFKELRKYFSASDICIFPKETTLSSIHAQVCRCSVIMERYKSNIERVVNDNNLYNIDDIEGAANIVSNLIKEEQYKKSNNLNLIKEINFREYKHQLAKLYKELEL